MRRTAVILSTLLIMVMVICAEAFAASNDEISEKAINYYTVSFTRTSGTDAQARVTAKTTTGTAGIKSAITLQKYNQSSSKYVNITTRTKESDGYSISHVANFTISSTGKYRVKAVLTDSDTTQIKYKELT